MSGGSGQFDWHYAAPPRLDLEIIRQAQLQVDRQIVEMWQAGAYTLPIPPQDYILYVV